MAIFWSFCVRRLPFSAFSLLYVELLLRMVKSAHIRKSLFVNSIAQCLARILAERWIVFENPKSNLYV